MTLLSIYLICLGLIFGGGAVGLLIGRVLPEHYLSEGTQKVVQIAMGTISIMAALVLGLLIATARNTMASRDKQVEALAGDLVLLDRDLVQYGPDAQTIRQLLRQYTALKLQHTWPKRGHVILDDPQALALLEGIQQRLRELHPDSLEKHLILAEALQVCDGIARTRSLMAVEHRHEIPREFLFVLVFWLAVLFLSFGVFAPRNAMVVAALFVCAVCLSSAILLIVDMDQPFSGIITISPEPIQHALLEMR
jgi:Protein of unknown function (DUF4239)